MQAGVSSGQIVSGSIVGTVADASGGTIPGVKVTATNEETNLTRETLTNDSGYFAIPSLPPGRYRVAASQPGFKSAQVSGIELLIDQTVRVDLKLEVGNITDQITISADAVQLQTETPTLGQVIEEKPITDLPLNGRNFIQLANLSAGVIPATSRSAESSRLGRVNVTAHVAGARASFNSFLMDGMENRGSRFGEVPILPSPDAIKEFKIQRNYYSAEYGQNVGVVSISIKSGTNGLHGSAYEFIRNDNLDARQFFDRGEPPEFKLNQFGFSIGGPMIRDRTFFFGAYEGRRQRRANQGFATLPDPQWLLGDFSNRSTPIRDPFNNNQPFANNIIPQSRISGIARNYNQYIPAPNTNVPQGNFSGAPPSTDDFDQFHVRVDHQFSSTDTIFGRYSWSDWNIDRPGLLPFRGLAFPLDGQNVVIQETHIFGTATVNNVKLGYSRGFLSSALIPADRPIGPEIGFKNLSILPPDYNSPGISMAGFSGLGYAANTFRHWTNTYAVSDTLALTRGRHNFTLGGDVRHHRTPQITTNASNGNLAFTDRFTGFSVADYVLGTYTSATALSFTTPRDFRYNQYALFLQDDYKVLSNLTLNMGLRWEYSQPQREKGGTEGVFDPSIPGMRLANDPSMFGFNIQAPWIVVGGVREGVIRPDFADFAPRFGLAYQIGQRTVIRAGFGIFYAMNQGNDIGSTSQNPGASVSTSTTNSPGVVPRLMDTLFDSAFETVTGAGTALSTSEPERRTPYLQQWNLNVQQELPAGFLLELGYTGSKGTELMGRQDLNQARLNLPGENLPVQQRRPYPQFQSILQFEGGEVSNYHGMALRLERRFSAGFHLLTNYTWSKSMDTESRSIDDGASPHHVSTNRALDWGLSSFDVRQRFVTSAIWELPVGPGKRFLGSARGWQTWLLRGWQANTIVQLQSGNPFSITVAGDQSNTAVFANQRPHRVGHGILPDSEKLPERWFDTAAYVLNPVNTFGNAGRDTLYEDGVQTIDLSFFKNSYFGEGRYNLQFRAEFFNLFNTVNFGRPGQVVNGANYGVLAEVAPAREIQFALKFIF
jgi:hypothetical protein